MGNAQVVDTMINDALWDAFNDYHMGVTAENIANNGILQEKNKMNFRSFSRKS